MLMNPQYPPGCYADMYRSHVQSYPAVHPAAAVATSAAAIHSHPQHVFQNNNMAPDFFSSASLSSSCYTPTPPPSDHGLMGIEQQANYYGYAPTTTSMDTTSHLYPSQWRNPLMEDKRESVIMGQPPQQPPPKRKGGRKPKDDPNLPPAEKHKRMLRRLRNKEAAAKCRERRLNHTSGLIKQIEDMERQQKQFEEQITQLRNNKQKCEKLLETHRRACDKTFIIPASTTATTSSNTASSIATASSTTSSPASTILLPPATTCSPMSSHSGSETPNSICTNNSSSSSNSYQPISYQESPVTTASATMTTASSRRKQTTPKLSLDTCAASHRMSSSSSNSDLHSPLIMP